ncbi:abscisic acid-deficient protein Aba4 family protein [Streptomyces caeruleatus]|uniref:DUF4281 domain-containing protein n=1 Tax=Streptomyces caeruleatus TaxID=661399 RepID=A0A101TKT5_9ACTN|nr:abscisic acid-deficient protein Aba4 family protein [Streptomyces caeruleatus]KUN94142.1 hypothetical protein AQJ67_38005 [Streptomyces caeruleatus]
MTGLLFELSFWLAAPVWLLMIFAPAWGPTARIAGSPWTAVPVLLVYLALAVPVFPELWTAVSSPDLDTFRDLTALLSPFGLLLFLGMRAARSRRTSAVPRSDAMALSARPQ